MEFNDTIKIAMRMKDGAMPKRECGRRLGAEVPAARLGATPHFYHGLPA